jgi:5-methyltetrahydrofolate--homocysteine methyltransferase
VTHDPNTHHHNDSLTELLQDRGVVLFDSAMGSALMALDLATVLRSERVNVRHPECVTAIHRENIDAGSDVITSNTFGVSALLADEVRNGDFAEGQSLVSWAMGCARAAVRKDHVLVALDIGPTGKLVELSDDLTHEEAYRIFATQVKAGAAAGADLVLIETMADLGELKDAVSAAKDSCDLPVLCTMTFEKNGRSYMGADPVTFAREAEALGATAVGVNCTLAPDEIIEIVRAIAGATTLPVIAQPNASQPVLRDGKQFYPITPPVFAADAAALVDAGATLLGGCCGTTPMAIDLLDNILTENGKRKERKSR